MQQVLHLTLLNHWAAGPTSDAIKSTEKYDLPRVDHTIHLRVAHPQTVLV